MDKETEKDKSFLQSVKEELQIETFTKDEKDFSPEKVQALVQLLELEDDIDEAEIYAAQERFKKNFKEKTHKLIQANKRKRMVKGILKTAAIFAIVFIVGDVSARAIWNEGLFHMVQQGEHWLVVEPGKCESEEFEETQIVTFNTIEEFAQDFGEDFLVCSWLPENVELNWIEKHIVENRSIYMIIYQNVSDNEKDFVIHIYTHGLDDTAGFVNTSLEEVAYYKQFKNGINAAFYEKADGYLAGFDYNGWWYLVETTQDETLLDLIIEGMEKYE